MNVLTEYLNNSSFIWGHGFNLARQINHCNFKSQVFSDPSWNAPISSVIISLNQSVLLQVERGRSNNQGLPAAQTINEKFTLKCEIKTAAWWKILLWHVEVCTKHLTKLSQEINYLSFRKLSIIGPLNNNCELSVCIWKKTFFHLLVPLSCSSKKIKIDFI